MDALIHGTFHFHSTYSHDGRTTLTETVSRLRRQQFSFCIMTEHFEDFDSQKLGRYVEEVRTLNKVGGFVLVPGVELNLSGVDTIIFPVRDYEQCARFAARRNGKDAGLFAVLAHPSKYSPEKIVRHLETCHIDGIEIWNQQADSSYSPPVEVMDFLKSCANRHAYRYFFGCDLHDVRLTVSNVVSLPRPEQLDVDLIVAAISSGTFLVTNRCTGISYRNSENNTGLDEWLANVAADPNFKGRLLRRVRRGLRGVYRSLPKPVQSSLNDLKNFVRNKV
jgi:hypothetical protein